MSTPRVLIKGGVWKNTEDEILKASPLGPYIESMVQAAVMKYGKNQWARISSLLVRKSPKQCKARWFEWLDPSIKKMEWAKEEDEKLLHLAKLMPTQWRTIAPIVGRTPAQCLERYQKLLDDAEVGMTATGEQIDRGVTGEDVRKLRPGEIDPNPETKPARPDPVDMDEDEKEMLSEARARLANTQGKKAKRKAREKQLEEARRLSQIQKRREMKNAGLSYTIRKKYKGMDYNADIPFYAKAPAGFWDTLEEKEKEKNEKKKLTGQTLDKIEGKRRAEVEDELRKKDIKRQKVRKEQGDYIAPHILKAAEEAEMMISQRKKLVLPAPQVSDRELEEIVKIGQAGETTRSIVDSEDNAASKSLLGDYSSSMRAPTPMRTPRNEAPGEDRLKTEARNLRAMQSSQTPLLGDDVHLQGDVEFTGGVTPKPTAAYTPNPLAAHLTPRADSVGAKAFGRTPMRDEMGINTPRSTVSQFEETPRQERQRQSLVRQQLSSLFAKLPQPSNDFEIIIPDQDEIEKDQDEEEGLMEEDAAEVHERMEKRRLAQEQERLLKRSTAVKRDLPRPISIRHEPFETVSSLDDIEQAENMIIREMEALLRHDAVEYPAPGQLPVVGAANQELQDVSLKYLEQAQDLIQSQVAELKKSRGLVSDEYDDETFSRLHDDIVNQYTFLYDPKPGKLGQFKLTSTLSKEQLAANTKNKMDYYKDLMRQQAQKAAKIEKKLSITLGGYQSRANKLKKELLDVAQEIQDADIEYESFYALKNEVEDPGLESRLQKLKAEVNALMEREKQGQLEHQDLLLERDALLSRLQG